MTDTTNLVNLRGLAAQINDAHLACENAASTALDHAYDAGRLLADAKLAVGHGGWVTWLAVNCQFSVRTAQVYLKLHANREAIESKAQSTAHLSIAAALKSLPCKPAIPQIDDGDEILRLLPDRGNMNWLLPPNGSALGWEISRSAWIVPHTEPGFYFVSVFAPDCLEDISVIGNKRGLKPQGIALLLRNAGNEVGVNFFDEAIEVISEPEQPWAFHQYLFHNHQNHIKRVVLGRSTE